jgi:general secretion pathway protein I
MMLLRPTGCSRTTRRNFGRARGRRGLSLLEVILALAILVLSLSAISQLVDLGNDLGNDARALTRGTRLAQGKMAEIEAGLVSVTSTTTGQFDGDDAAWSFQVIPEAAGPPNLYTVTVRVNRDVRGRQFEYVLIQMLFDPAYMGSAAQAEITTPSTGTGTTTGSGTTTGMGGTSP